MRTAAAAASFTFLICGLTSDETSSARDSIAVLNNSAAKTKQITKQIQNHSPMEIFNKKPKSNAIIAAAKWTLKLYSLLKVSRNPWRAYINESKKLCFFIIFVFNTLFRPLFQNTLPLNFSDQTIKDR